MRRLTFIAILLLSLAFPLREALAQISEVSPVYQVGGAISPPKLTHQTDPKTPRGFLGIPKQGVVLINIIVDVDGLPKKIKVARSSGNEKVDKSALDAVAKYKFEPARKGDQPVAVEINVEVTFKL